MHRLGFMKIDSICASIIHGGENRVDSCHVPLDHPHTHTHAWTYNLGIHDCSTGRCYMYMWSESLASRGSKEVISCLHKHLQRPTTATTLIAFTVQISTKVNVTCVIYVQQISVPFEHSIFRDCSVSVSGSFRASQKQYGLEHAEVQNRFCNRTCRNKDIFNNNRYVHNFNWWVSTAISSHFMGVRC